MKRPIRRTLTGICPEQSTTTLTGGGINVRSGEARYAVVVRFARATLRLEWLRLAAARRT
jgi:hypothetical protein